MKWGSPNPPYVVFKYQNKKWDRITLLELPAELTTPNLIFSSPDDEARKSGQPTVSAEAIKRLSDSYRQPHYKTILRTPIDSGPSRPEYKGPKAPHPIPPSAMISKTVDFETLSASPHSSHFSPGWLPRRRRGLWTGQRSTKFFRPHAKLSVEVC